MNTTPPIDQAATPVALSPRVLRHLRMTFAQSIATKNKTKNPAERDALSRVIAQIASELGVPYQP